MMGDTCLISAIRNGYPDDYIRDLMKKSSDINCKNEEGYTALMYLINLDPHKYNLIKELIEISDCNVKDYFGFTTLFLLMDGIVFNQFDEQDALRILEHLLPRTDLHNRCKGMTILDYLEKSERHFTSSLKRRELYKKIEYLLVKHMLITT